MINHVKSRVAYIGLFVFMLIYSYILPKNIRTGGIYINIYFFSLIILLRVFITKRTPALTLIAHRFQTKKEMLHYYFIRHLRDNFQYVLTINLIFAINFLIFGYRVSLLTIIFVLIHQNLILFFVSLASVIDLLYNSKFRAQIMICSYFILSFIFLLFFDNSISLSSLNILYPYFSIGHGDLQTYSTYIIHFVILILFFNFRKSGIND